MATKKTNATTGKKATNKATETKKATHKAATVTNTTTTKEEEAMKTKKTATTKKATNNTESKKATNRGRVTNNKTQQAAARQKAKEQEQAQKAKEQEQKQREQLKEQATQTKAAAKETAKEIRATFQGAKAEVKEAHTPLYYFTLLNKMAQGKKEVQNVNASQLAKAYDLTATATQTAYNREGFSYDVVKTNSRGQICRLIGYTPAEGDEHRTNPAGAHVVTTQRYNAVEVMELYSGPYLLIPVTINENGILSAVESYLQAYAAAVPDLLAFGKRYDQMKQQRQAEKEAAKRAKEIHEALKAAKEKAEAAAKEAEEAQRAAEEDTHRTNVAAMTTPAPARRSFFARLRAAMF